MKTAPILLLVIAFLACFTLSPVHAGEYHTDIAGYVEFLQGPAIPPVDYIMNQFEKYDLVILCERAHGDVTQYQLITELVRDKRFVEKVGNVFTEIGITSIRKKLQEFLADETLSKQAIEETLLDIYRNLEWFPLWGITNFYDFLKNIHTLNCGLPPEKKVRVFPSDMPFSWDGMTPEKYREFRSTLVNRDVTMAREVARTFRYIQATETRKKALVIMNYRHAFNDFPLAGDHKVDNTGRFLFEQFPGKVANILLNTTAIIQGASKEEFIDIPLQAGWWDAAFRVTGETERGFDFSGTPFGKDHFDLWSFRPHKATYQDVFTGLVFYLPLKRHKLMVGIPGLFGGSFKEIYAKRMEVTGIKLSVKELDDCARETEQIREFPYKELQEFEKAIRRWL